MKDLTTGPVSRHILTLSAFIALTTVFQTLYFLADLYFVGRIGKEAIAGVALAGNLTMVVLALTQSLGVGVTSLVAQAVGRGQRHLADVFFNQGFVLAFVIAFAYGATAFALRHAYTGWLAADHETAARGVQYLNWFIPAMCLQFPMVAMGSALRALGDMKMPTTISVVTVTLNIVLAPILMFGWGTGHPLGVTGAGLASFIAIAFGCVLFVLYFLRPSSPLNFEPWDWRPRVAMWGQILRIGIPAGGEFIIVAVYIVLVYDIIRPFGAAAQAGFGIGARVMQAVFLPAVAIAFATAPVAGQNFGARQGARVRQAFASGAKMAAAVMFASTLVCQIAPAALVGFFNNDPAVVAFGSQYLRIISWNFVASGVTFVTSSVFQGIGNTIPSLASSCLRLVLFAVPAYLLSRHPGFQMTYLWYISLATVILQMFLNLWLLNRELARKLVFEVTVPVTLAQNDVAEA